MPTEVVEIDGSYGEGGGSILRVATGLAAATGRAVRIVNIRANRPRPGLAAQHLTGLRTLTRLFDAETKGAEIGSTEVTFIPRRPRLRSLSVDVGTAGSISLVLQSVMIALSTHQGEVSLELTGGTHVRWAPNYDYLSNVTVPVLKRMGYHSEVRLERPGYYPKGGGKVSFRSVGATRLQPAAFERFGKLEGIHGVSRASNLPEHVAKRQAKSASEVLSRFTDPEIEVKVERSFSPGSSITVWAVTSEGCRLGASALGERGKPAEQVGREAGEEMAAYLREESPMDPYMLDQLIPYCALAEGTSVLKASKLTKHAVTNVYVASRIAGCRIDVEGELGEPCTIRIRGLGGTE